MGNRNIPDKNNKLQQENKAAPQKVPNTRSKKQQDQKREEIQYRTCVLDCSLAHLIPAHNHKQKAYISNRYVWGGWDGGVRVDQSRK